MASPKTALTLTSPRGSRRQLQQDHSSSSCSSYDLEYHGPATSVATALPSPQSNQPSQHQRSRRTFQNPLLRVQQVGRHAALTTKQVVWDSNDASIHAALSAIDQWEAAYRALRSLLVASLHSAKKVYEAAKEGAETIDDGFFKPVRDWIILPAFLGAEQAVTQTARFLQSEQARVVAEEALVVTRQVPYVGESILAPAMCFSVAFVQRFWEVAQYPIPSKHRVRETVDLALTSAKWALTTAFREVFMYVKRADANITRALSHTQWKVLGSGPYATLEDSIKRDVIDHICERYLDTKELLGRYELAEHIRRHNRPLYNDLVTTGVLKTRGGQLLDEDVWLLPNPEYRAHGNPFFLKTSLHGPSKSTTNEETALWFRLPYVNGKRPAKDAPWVCFRRKEQKDLEKRYLKILKDGTVTSDITSGVEVAATADTPNEVVRKYPTIAQWYEPNLTTDVLVDQDRHAASFFLCCPVCRQHLPPIIPPMAPKKIGDLCESCSKTSRQNEAPTLQFGVPPIAMVMRPTLWRFHGPGDEIQRASWFVDTKRNGLQPFSEEAQAVLEDAYMLLHWIHPRQGFATVIDGALLTVEVTGPDGGSVLVQFSSLTHATAISKGVGSALAIFKRRVYRGASLVKDTTTMPTKVPSSQLSIEESILRAVEKNGSLGETPVPNVSIRSVILPPEPIPAPALVAHDESKLSLAVPPSRLEEEDMAKYLVDLDDQEIDHLVLIVHGIGEMMRSIDVFGLSLPHISSIIECCGYLRRNHVQVQECQLASDAKCRQGRVEYLPVEWHEAFSILSQRRKSHLHPVGASNQMNVMLNDISLRTIPQMREFANDTMMDVLYFMSPSHHDVIVDVVATEMNFVVRKFRELTDFAGRISIIGHSLGSIISWDILANQDVTNGHERDYNPFYETDDDLPKSEEQLSLDSMHSWDVLANQDAKSVQKEEVVPTSETVAETAMAVEQPKDNRGFLPSSSDRASAASTTSLAEHFANADNNPPLKLSETVAEIETQEYTLSRASLTPCESPMLHESASTSVTFHHTPRSKEQTPSYPQLSFPVSNFFLLGSPVAVFLMIRNQREPLHEEFYLRGCRRVFNIFHPYDPVAYRIEPCIDPRNADFPPTLMPHWNGGLRVQYQTKRLWRKLVDTTYKRQQDFVAALEASVAGIGLLPPQREDDEFSYTDETQTHEVITGSLNQSRRIDYMMQEKEIEAANEYVAALAAHSSYWIEKDLSLFIARQIYFSNAEIAEQEEWECISPSPGF